MLRSRLEILWDSFNATRAFRTAWPNRPRAELLRYLDDREHQKCYPGDSSRSLPGEHIVHTEPFSDFDIPELDSRFCWSLVRFHRSADGNLSFSECGGGDGKHFNPWSASKVLSIALASLCLREAGLGLDVEVKGLPLGDLVTLVCAYDTSRAYGSAPLDSNKVASYFHSLIGPEAPTHQLRGRLGLSATAFFETSYGTKFANDPRLPEPEGYKGGRGRGRGEKVLNVRMLASGFSRALLELHPEDLKVLLYGAEVSKWYPTSLGEARVEMGGMCADPSIYIQAALDMDRIEHDSGGRWRIFSKLGYGPAASRADNEFVLLSYLYLPVLDKTASPIPDFGKECVLVARFDGEGMVDDEADKLFADNLARLIRRL